MRLNVIDTDRCIGCQVCMFACSRSHGRPGLGGHRMWVRSAGGMERGFVVIVCRACADPSCAAVCPNQALIPRKGGGVILKSELCTGCGHCRSACPIGAVGWDEEAQKPMICIHCGYCAQHCPHEVLGVEKGER